jgi:hypothetical protein
MTKKELSQLYYLNREIEQYEQKLSELRSVACDTSTKITGMPHCGGVSDKVSKIAVEIAYISETIENKKRQCWAEYHRLIDYINGIDDSLTRTIFMHRFVNGMEWEQVAASIGGSTADCCRMIANRYIRRNL